MSSIAGAGRYVEDRGKCRKFGKKQALALQELLCKLAKALRGHFGNRALTLTSGPKEGKHARIQKPNVI